MICTPSPKAFGTPTNYIYFDLIVSYLIILTTEIVKLPILWSQISPCRPRKQILLNFFLGFNGRCHHAPAKASSSTPRIFIHLPPNENRLWLVQRSYEDNSLINDSLFESFLSMYRHISTFIVEFPFLVRFELIPTGKTISKCQTSYAMFVSYDSGNTKNQF